MATLELAAEIPLLDHEKKMENAFRRQTFASGGKFFPDIALLHGGHVPALPALNDTDTFEVVP